jgi:hypothetical protein
VEKIKAIETNYAGCRFRSRLEARWAVFFDTLGIKWEYEKEGYKLADGTCYLPDFWLPQVNMWAEVKPDTPNEIEIQKARGLAAGTGFPVLLLDGLPRCTNFWGVHPPEEDYPEFMDYHISEGSHYWLDEGRFFSNTGTSADFPNHCAKDELYDCDSGQEAVTAAMSARFGT